VSGLFVLDGYSHAFGVVLPIRRFRERSPKAWHTGRIL